MKGVANEIGTRAAEFRAAMGWSRQIGRAPAAERRKRNFRDDLALFMIDCHMSLRFHRRLRLGPGVSLNLGKSGLTSVSFGRRGVHYTVGRRGPLGVLVDTR